jgi:hypothetical protein
MNNEDKPLFDFSFFNEEAPEEEPVNTEAVKALAKKQNLAANKNSKVVEKDNSEKLPIQELTLPKPTSYIEDIVIAEELHSDDLSNDEVLALLNSTAKKVENFSESKKTASAAANKQNITAILDKELALDDTLDKEVFSSQRSKQEGSFVASEELANGDFVPKFEEVADKGAAPAKNQILKSEVSQVRPTEASLNERMQNKALKEIEFQLSSYKNSKDLVDKISVKLEPAELGVIEISFKYDKSGSVKVDLACENFNTLSMLKNSEERINAIFADNGFNTTSLDYSFAFNQNNDGKQEKGQEFANSNFKNGSDAEGKNKVSSYTGKIDLYDGKIDIMV